MLPPLVVVSDTPPHVKSVEKKERRRDCLSASMALEQGLADRTILQFANRIYVVGTYLGWAAEPEDGAPGFG